MQTGSSSSDNAEAIQEIRTIKRELGKRLIILAHHYQRKEIVELGDFVGDSFELSRKAAADKDCRYIVFCGVHFMAESAAILAQPGQIVQIPDLEAGCWMADMADSEMLKFAWEEIEYTTGKGSTVPVVYMNSDAELKSFCGNQGGIVCTSSNAGKAVKWAFGQKEKVLFFPDQYLGRNVAHDLGISLDEIVLWSPGKDLGGNDMDELNRARMILWDGYCLVHTRFTVQQIERMRAEYPGARIVVHPECTREVTALADANGSTSFIVKYVKEAPEGSTIIIGTEINLVQRLAMEYPGKKILPLHNSLCPNMYKINLMNLLQSLQNPGRINVVEVPEDIKAGAKLALDRMLRLA